MTKRSSLSRTVRALLAVFLAVAVWVPALGAMFGAGATEDEKSRRAELLLTEQLDPWKGGDSETVDRMRVANPEWDFMGRTFLVLALANRALSFPDERARNLSVMDDVINATMRADRRFGMHYFLLPYSRRAPFVREPEASMFVDGELALMIAARQAVEPRRDLHGELRERIQALVEVFESAPMMSGESYPDECWTFCNTTALAAIRLSDLSLGTDHSALMTRWVAHARANLLDEETRMLISSYTYEGEHLDGPEGSSIFMSATNLLLVDPEFAREQYDLAREHLAKNTFGFGYAREWSAAFAGPVDIDSGPIVPIVEASPGASGMAILGASAFSDDEWLRALMTSLDFAAFPIEDGTSLRYAASNQVGDAVALYAFSFGPLFALASEPTHEVIAWNGAAQ